MKYINAMAVGIVLLFTLLVGTSSAQGAGVPFMTVDEFVELHPDQAALMEQFNALVEMPGVKHQGYQKRPVKIAFIYPGLQISDYWRRSIQSFKARMDEVGVQYDLSEYFSKPAVDKHLQMAHVREALENNPDYLVFTMDIFKHKELIEEVMDRGTTKLILQNITTPLREWEGRQPFMYVGFDHTIGSRILADYYMSKVGPEGAYGLLYFTRGYVSTMRGDTFRNYVAAGSNIKMREAVFTDGKLDRAYAATSSMLSNYKLDFIYACSTDIAIGAIQALEADGMTDSVLVNGWGGGSSELEAILAGKLDVTVMRMNDDNGVAMAEAIRWDIEGRGHEVPTIYSGEMVLVEKGISKKALNALVKRAFRYSGK